MRDCRLSKQAVVSALRTAHRGTRLREAYSLKAVILLGSSWTPADVADALPTEADSVRNLRRSTALVPD